MTGVGRAPEAVGVVVPVRDEAAALPGALGAIEIAAAAVPPSTEVAVVVVLDGCRDASAAVAARWRRRGAPAGRTVVRLVAEADLGNVGAARALGARTLLASWVGRDPGGLWLASTDADTLVPPSWLTHQIGLAAGGVGVWAGRVDVGDWAGWPAGLAGTWRHAYAAEADPVHGASLGIAVPVYLAVGGFAPLATGEDRALVAAAGAAGATVRYGGGTPVLTSARHRARAPLGFAHRLAAVAAGLAATVDG